MASECVKVMVRCRPMNKKEANRGKSPFRYNNFIILITTLSYYSPSSILTPLYRLPKHLWYRQTNESSHTQTRWWRRSWRENFCLWFSLWRGLKVERSLRWDSVSLGWVGHWWLQWHYFRIRANWMWQNSHYVRPQRQRKLRNYPECFRTHLRLSRWRCEYRQEIFSPMLLRRNIQWRD